jgi:hypothetical protein
MTDLTKLTLEDLLRLHMRECSERHVETKAEFEQMAVRIGDVATKLETLTLETRALGAMTARAIEAQLEPIRSRIGGIADDTSAVRRTVNGADFLAHTRFTELEQRVKALESKHAANGGE